MTERRCGSCGAPLPENGNACEYCGMTYEREKDDTDEVIFYADDRIVERIRRGEGLRPMPSALKDGKEWR